MQSQSLVLAGVLLCLVTSPLSAQKPQATQVPAPQAQSARSSQSAQSARSALQSPNSNPAAAEPEKKPSDQSAQSGGVAITTVASIAQIITGAVAVMFGLLAWRYNERSIRRLARQDHIRMLIDIDKIYIERPTLWRIYADEYQNLPEPGSDEAKASAGDPWEPARRRGLIYLYLNMFDAAYDFDRHLNWRNLSRRTASDREYLESWTVFVRDFFARSPEAFKLMNASKDIYSKGFVEFVHNLMPGAPGEKQGAGGSKSTAA